MQLKRRPIIFLLLVFSFGVFGQNSFVFANSCFDFLAQNSIDSQIKSPSSVTRGFIAYLDLLLEKNVIDEQGFSYFIDSLKAGQLTNPIDEVKAELKSERYEHFKGFQEYLERGDLEIDAIFEWALERSKEEEKEREERKEVARETQDRIHQEIEFGFVPAGSFVVGQKYKEVPATLTRSFEAMTTPVTQWMWVEVMGENPSYYADGAYSIATQVNGKSVTLQPDHPVENLTWWSAVVFANRLSRLHGLKPAYDLSQIKWKPDTRAENGTLDIESGDIGFANYYSLEGYRLPTEVEQEHLLRLAEKGEDAGLKDYAWSRENSEHRTQPVAELNPLVVEAEGVRSEFFDLLGNVSEWSWNRQSKHGGPIPVQGGVDPIGIFRGSSRYVRGGDFTFSPESLDVFSDRLILSARSRNESVGFRLVRTIK